MKKALTLFAIAVVLAGCGSGSSGSRFYFEDNPAAGENEDKITVALDEALLNQPLLFQASVSTYLNIDQFTGLKSRIVSFQDRGNQIILAEDMSSYTVHRRPYEPAALVSFPIIDRSQGKVTIDFNKGFNKLFVYNDWYASDFGGKYVSSTWDQADLRVSYLNKAERVDEAVVIEQIARLPQAPIRVLYYFTPYQPDKEFDPTESSDFRNYGFFETSPIYREQGLPVTYATKFQHKNGISYALSANTPVKWRDAVSDGILYWNKAFGEEVITVEIAPESVKAPDFRYNLVQWMEYETAAFAYADAQMDPLTGEVRHAQVFFPSSWAISGKEKARRVLEMFKKAVASEPGLSIIGLEKEGTCRHRLAHGFRRTLSQLLAEDADDNVFHRASEDYIREVVAHEVGHTLGLRHNFAGTLVNQSDAGERERLMKLYLQDALDYEVIPEMTSSVMDYHPFLESVLVGRGIAEGKPALAYDKKAIDLLYRGASSGESGHPKFCTDSSYALDCLRFDYGRSPVDYYLNEGKKYQERLAYDLLESFIFAKAPLFLDPIRINEVAIDGSTIAIYLNLHRFQMSSLLKYGTYLDIQAEFPTITDLNREEAKSSVLDRHLEGITRFGGLEKIYAQLDKDYLDQLEKRFLELLSQKRTGTGPGGPYSFTDQEVSYLKKMIKKLVAVLKEKIPRAELDSLLVVGSDLPEHEIFNQIASLYKDRATKIILEESGESTGPYTFTYKKEGDDEAIAATLTLPTFAYPAATRLRAVKLLDESRGTSFGWRQLFQASKEIQSAFEGIMEKALKPLEHDEIEHLKLPPEVGEWYLENKEILDALNMVAMSDASRTKGLAEDDDGDSADSFARLLHRIEENRNLGKFHLPELVKQWKLLKD